MKWKKSNLLKFIIFLLSISLTWQCTTITKGSLISSEEKINETIIQGYQLGIEKIKDASYQDPVLEYKILKFPINQGRTISTFEKVKIKHTKPMLWGFVIGGGIGFIYGQTLPDEPEGFRKSGNTILSTIGLGLVGLVIGRIINGKIFEGLGGKVDIADDPIIKNKVFFEANKTISTPVPNCPITFKWELHKKQEIFNIISNDQGILRIDLLKDLKIPVSVLKEGIELTLNYIDNRKKRTYLEIIKLTE